MKTERDYLLDDIKVLTKIDIDVLSVKSVDSGVNREVDKVHKILYGVLSKLFANINK